MKIEEVNSKIYRVGTRAFITQPEAEDYLQTEQRREHEKAIFDALEFTVHEDHLKLMRRLYFDWFYCETGAPCVNGKRPYGNSSVLYDIADILGVPLVEVDSEARLPDSEIPRLWDRHLEMKNFLEILCRFGEIPSGVYKRRATHCAWEKVVPPPTKAAEGTEK